MRQNSFLFFACSGRSSSCHRLHRVRGPDKTQDSRRVLEGEPAAPSPRPGPDAPGAAFELALVTVQPGFTVKLMAPLSVSASGGLLVLGAATHTPRLPRCSSETCGALEHVEQRPGSVPAAQQERAGGLLTQGVPGPPFPRGVCCSKQEATKGYS